MRDTLSLEQHALAALAFGGGYEPTANAFFGAFRPADPPASRSPEMYRGQKEALNSRPKRG